MKTINTTMPNTNTETLLESYERNRHPMDKAVKHNDIDFVKNNLDLTDDQILYYAIREGNTEIFEYVFPLFSLESQRKALWSIGSKGRMDYLDFVLKYITVDINDKRSHELACRSGHLEMVKRLESLGIKKSEHSFYYAFESNSLEMIEHVYENEDISKCFIHQSHSIPLDVLKFIMSHTQLSENNKYKVLMGAAAAGFIDVIDYLLTLPEPAISEGALFETVYFGNQLPTMKHLLTKAPVLSDIAEWDYKAFCWAYDKNYEDFVDYLVNIHHVTPETSPEIFKTMQSDNFALYNKVLKLPD